MTIQQRRNSHRLVTLVVGVALTVAGAVIGSSGSASAHHPFLDASVNCNSVVTWTASSWLPPDEGDVTQHRTNSQVDVTYSVEGYGPTVAVATGAFNSGNGFQFGGHFSYPDGAAKILLTATAVASWGNGSPGGDSWSVWVYQPETCQEEPTTTVGETTTTLVSSGGPTTTIVSSGGPTTTVGSGGGSLPRTGQSTSAMLMMSLGIVLIGASIALSARRRFA